MRRQYYCIVFIICLSVANSVLASQPAINISQYINQSITPNGVLYDATRIQLPPENKSELKTWQDSLGTPVNLSLVGGQYWYVVDIVNDTDTNHWVLDVQNGLVEYLQYIIYTDRKKYEFNSGYYSDDAYYLSYGRQFNLPAEQTATLVIYLASPYFASQPAITVTSKADYEDREFGFVLQVVLALGALLCLSIYNFFIYLGARQKYVFYYACYLLCYSIAWALVFQVPMELFQWHWLNIHYVPFLLLPLLSGRFCIHFLNLDEHMPKLSRTISINGYISAVMALLSVVYISYAHAVATLLIGIWIAAALYGGVMRLIQGFKPAGYFVGAFLCLLIPACFILPANIGLIPDLLDNAELVTLIGGTLDAILLSFAMAYRMRLIECKNKELTVNLEVQVNKRTDELRQSNLQLTEANVSKTEFLANMSHEIRTPLTAIMGYAEVMQWGDVERDKQLHFSHIITENSAHLLSVLDDILDVSKIEANKLTFEFVQFDLISVLLQVESIVHKRARDKGLGCDFRFDYPLPQYLVTDQVRLKQILFNLLNNSLKFTDEGYVNLSVRVVDDMLQLVVADSGIGMTESQQSKVFSAFEQGDNSIDRRFGGTGLGLNIALHLAQGLNGKLSCDSVLGKGSNFSLCLPLTLTDNPIWVNNDIEAMTRVQNLVSTAPVPDLSGKCILLADDHDANRQLIAMYLSRMNANVVDVGDGLAALSAVASQSFDIILLDIHMPQMDGVQTMRKLRELNTDIPVIALTANAMTHQVQQFIRMGFDAHLAKPIVQDEFNRTLHHYLGAKQTNSSPDETEFQRQFDVLAKNYAKALSRDINNLRKSRERKQWSAMAEIIHRVKGSASSFGYNAIGSLFIHLDELMNSPEQQLAVIDSLLVQVYEQNQQPVDRIQELVPE